MSENTLTGAELQAAVEACPACNLLGHHCSEHAKDLEAVARAGKRAHRQTPEARLANAMLANAYSTFAAGRASFHSTYNGGHHDKEEHEAFHHGMDTVFNALDHAAAIARRKADGDE